MAETEWDAWLETRPASVQQLAREFPLHTQVRIDGQLYYLLGYTECDSLIVSKISPYLAYEQALATQEYICAAHVREGVPCD